MTSQTTSGGNRVTTWNLVAYAGVSALLFWFLLCFCSVLPMVLFASFLFNAVFLGSSLFSALAQEREKRTIDALRLTQLSSKEILLYKSFGELRVWKVVNGLFLVATFVAALWSGSPLTWALLGAATMACGGLLSISLALAVSTRCETTSSAVVSGWITKGVWLAGLPILDYVLEAVLVLSRDLHLFSYLDPAWVYGTVVNGLMFETNSSTLTALLIGGLASVGFAYLLVLQSASLIDSSFESAATLEDRNRHSVYQKVFPFGLHRNPFMVREMAWQMRTGAGAWPGYAVFFTLFLAPFLYGLAQHQKTHDHKPVKVVRQNVAPTMPRQAEYTPIDYKSEQPSKRRYFRQTKPGYSGVTPPEVRLHDHLCLSQFMGLPVQVKHHRRSYSNFDADKVIVVGTDGKARKVHKSQMDSIQRQGDSKFDSGKSRYKSRVSKTQLQKELDRGLLTGLVLTILYLFIRGGAFMSGAVTGEKERRAWDQIALTGATPESYLGGKLIGVLYFPLKQLLLTSPILILFALYGGVSFLDVLLILPLLVASFLAAASLGLLCSTTQESSHGAQGKTLLTVAGVLLTPLVPGGWLLAGLGAYLLLNRSALDIGQRVFAAGAAALAVSVMGPAVSPIAGVMSACQSYGFGSFTLLSAGTASGAAMLLMSTVSMIVVGFSAFTLAVSTLQQGGSVKA